MIKVTYSSVFTVQAQPSPSQMVAISDEGVGVGGVIQKLTIAL